MHKSNKKDNAKLKGVETHMMEKQIKDLAWNTFKQTGNINTFMELRQVQNMQSIENIQPNQNMQGIKDKKD